MHTLYNLSQSFKKRDRLQPVFFIGHGSPLNGIQDNDFSQKWREIGKTIDTPSAVLVVSAHWLTRGTHVTAMEQPQTIHDFGGFPQELYEVQYPAPGSPYLAIETAKLLTKTSVGLDHEWGLDHGTWTVVRHLFPEANIPVLQLSIDYYKPAEHHYQLAAQLYDLRTRGVLIIGSGNMIHNLRMIDWNQLDTPGYGYDWALELNDIFKKKLIQKDHNSLVHYENFGEAARMAIPTTDHYLPMIYALGLQQKTEEIQIFNDRLIGGSLNMTSFQIGL